MLTRIPFYKEVILASFSCPHCNFENNEIQSAGEIQKEGVEFRLEVREKVDLDRQMVKSDYASVSIPELELEIPPASQKGEVTTIEGVLQRVVEGLKQDQDRRLTTAPDEFQQIEDFILKVESFRRLEAVFTLVSAICVQRHLTAWHLTVREKSYVRFGSKFG
jgi:zinc finger protein